MEPDSQGQGNSYPNAIDLDNPKVDEVVKPFDIEPCDKCKSAGNRTKDRFIPPVFKEIIVTPPNKIHTICANSRSKDWDAGMYGRLWVRLPL